MRTQNVFFRKKALERGYLQTLIAQAVLYLLVWYEGLIKAVTVFN